MEATLITPRWLSSMAEHGVCNVESPEVLVEIMPGNRRRTAVVDVRLKLAVSPIENSSSPVVSDMQRHDYVIRL